MEHNTEGAVLVDEKLKWSGGLVPYKISAQLKEESKTLITQALNEFNTQFKGILKCVSHSNDSDYVHFITGTESSSSVGKQGGEQFITIGPNSTKNEIMRQIVAAVGHQSEISLTSSADNDNNDQELTQKDVNAVRFIYKRVDSANTTVLILAHAAGVLAIAGIVYFLYTRSKKTT